MNKEEITLKVKDSNNGFTISNDINYQTGKVIINEIEITDIETWNKAISKQLDLQQENKQLKEKYINAVSDYETEKWKTQRIKTLLENNYYLRNGEKYIIEEEINEILEILKGE